MTDLEKYRQDARRYAVQARRARFMLRDERLARHFFYKASASLGMMQLEISYRAGRN